MSLFGPPNIARLKEKGKIKDLIKALDYRKDDKVRRQAVNALSDLRCREAVEPISTLLNELSGLNIELSSSCASALGNIGDPVAVKPLIEALMRTRHESKIEEILKLKRQSLLFSKGFDFKIAGKLAEDWITARYNYIQSVRITASKALGKIGNKEAIPFLIDTLKDKNPIVSRTSSDALAFLGQNAIEALIPLLHHNNDVRVRQLAFRALSQMNITEAKLLLQSFSSDLDEIIQGYIKSSSTSTVRWKPPNIEIVNELLELLDFYTAINIYDAMSSLLPNGNIDQKSIADDSVRDSVDILTQKYSFSDQQELDDILQKAISLYNKK